MALLERIEPAPPAEQAHHDLAGELLDDVRRLDDQLKESHRRIRLAVKASGTSLTDLGAARIGLDLRKRWNDEVDEGAGREAGPRRSCGRLAAYPRMS